MQNHSCMDCGHIGLPLEFGGETLCDNCGGRSVVACGSVGDRPVPMRVLRSAEERALYWKKQAEQLSAIINRAASAGAMAANYVTEARIIQAGL